MCSELKKNLLRLKELLQRERQCAAELKMDALQRLLREKTDLLSHIGLFVVDKEDPQLTELLLEVGKENRRNARLYHHSLAMARGCLSLYFRPTNNPSYSRSGQADRALASSQFLSGWI